MFLRNWIILVCWAGALNVYGIASLCCGTDSPRILASLQELRQLDFSLTTVFKEVYARYDSAGNVSLSQGPSQLLFQVTSVARLNPELELFGRLPLVLRSSDSITSRPEPSLLGDVLFGIRRTLYQGLYVEDATPHVSVLASIKIPTGFIDLENESRGNWEPYLGLGLQKERYQWLGNIDLGVSLRQKEVLFRASQSLGNSFLPSFQIGLGSQQTLSLNASQKIISLFSFAHWSVDPFTLVGAQVDWSLPLKGLGTNQPITRSASVSLRYTFF